MARGRNMSLDTQARLERDIRAAVIRHIESHPTAKTTLATRLQLPLESIERLLTRTRWDLPVAMSAADLLGVTIHVSSD